MALATHLIKIHGEINIFIWPKKKLRSYVDRKIMTEIESVLHPSLELFSLSGEKIEIWVYISAFPSEVSRDIVGKWIKDHIVERGLSVESFEIEIIASKVDRDFNKSKILIFLE